MLSQCILSRLGFADQTIFFTLSKSGITGVYRGIYHYSTLGENLYVHSANCLAGTKYE